MVCTEVQKGRLEQGNSECDAVTAPYDWLSFSAPSAWYTAERGA